jgi:hypothetical protein
VPSSQLASLRAVDATALTPRRRLGIITGREPPPIELTDAIDVATSPGKVPAPALSVPSHDVIRLSRSGPSGVYEATTCSADAYAAKGVQLAPSMIVDHVFGKYQHAIDAALLAIDGEAAKHGGADGGGHRRMPSAPTRTDHDDREAKAV